VSGVVLTRRGNRGHEIAVQNVYACVGDEQWIAVSDRHDDDWQALKGVLGTPEWAQSREYGAETAEVSDARLGEWLARQQLDVAVDALLAAGVPAAPVVAPPDVIDNPALRQRGFFQTADHPLCGPLPYPRPPITGRFVDRPAPLLGQHNIEVLGGALGLSAQDLGRLEDDEVIGTWPLGL
ncbi:MAG TPA: CoA transferase, partial [Mycobacterium sp.]|nr:CoA transferase [Mycobacterium sp.]